MMIRLGIAEEYNLDAAQLGALVTLSVEELEHGPLPNDLDCLLRRLHLPADDTSVITESLAQFFILGEDNFWRSKLVVMRWRKRGE